MKAATCYGAAEFRGGGISIHAAREGGDHIGFYVGKIVGISIHAAREGGDRRAVFGYAHAAYFNPRRP